MLSQLFLALKSLRISAFGQTVDNWNLAYLDVIVSVSVLKNSFAAVYLALETEQFKQLPQVPVQLFVTFKVFAGWTGFFSKIPFSDAPCTCKSAALQTLHRLPRDALTDDTLVSVWNFFKSALTCFELNDNLFVCYFVDLENQLLNPSSNWFKFGLPALSR